METFIAIMVSTFLAHLWAIISMEEKIDKKGIPFRLVVVNKVDFVWANASYIFLIQVGDTRKWGLDAPKSSKRANEIVRLRAPWISYEDHLKSTWS